MNRQQRRAAQKARPRTKKTEPGRFLAMIYAVAPWTQNRIHAANVWDHDLADEMCFLFVNGWSNLMVEVAHDQGRGRPIRFFYRVTPARKWEKLLAAEDIEALAEAQRRLCTCDRSGDVCKTCEHRGECEFHIQGCLSDEPESNN